MTEELKPCPFCGGKADFTVTGDLSPFRVVCDGCGALAGGSSFENNEYNARKWNTRASPWIPCKDRLPGAMATGFSDWVLISMNIDEKKFVSRDRYDFEKSRWMENMNVAHWQPLPAPPDKE